MPSNSNPLTAAATTADGRGREGGGGGVHQWGCGRGGVRCLHMHGDGMGGLNPFTHSFAAAK